LDKPGPGNTPSAFLVLLYSFRVWRLRNLSGYLFRFSHICTRFFTSFYSFRNNAACKSYWYYPPLEKLWDTFAYSSDFDNLRVFDGNTAKLAR
jgi:hypothetical protein